MSIQNIFQTEEFNNLSNDEFINKFKNHKDFNILKHLKEIQTYILNNFKLNLRMWDAKGNEYKWNEGEKRGNRPYDPPIGSIGFGLKVIDCYEENNWLGNNNSPGEWCVAYHAVGSVTPEEINKIIFEIVKSGFKKGARQIHKYCNDSENPGKKVGEGVHFTPSFLCVEQYTTIIHIKGKMYKVVLIVRVNPKFIRRCECSGGLYWVLNGCSDEVRLYRILLKSCD